MERERAASDNMGLLLRPKKLGDLPDVRIVVVYRQNEGSASD